MSKPLPDMGEPLFFRVANPDEPGLAPPENRLGQGICLAARSLSVMQKEAAVIYLDVGEQTCFLHALCRTDLRARVKITDYKCEAA